MTNTPETFDPLALTVFAQGVAMIAEEMGTRLERAAVSPNIRERRDASCAVFDAEGRMIAQAAHIPVHLGAMPESVAVVRARTPPWAMCSCSTTPPMAARTSPTSPWWR
jgi:N-methylhydantoinase B